MHVHIYQSSLIFLFSVVRIMLQVLHKTYKWATRHYSSLLTTKKLYHAILHGYHHLKLHSSNNPHNWWYTHVRKTRGYQGNYQCQCGVSLKWGRWWIAWFTSIDNFRNGIQHCLGYTINFYKKYRTNTHHPRWHLGATNQHIPPQAHQGRQNLEWVHHHQQCPKTITFGMSGRHLHQDSLWMHFQICIIDNNKNCVPPKSQLQCHIPINPHWQQH